MCATPRELDLDELLDHVLSRHPREAIGMMRDLLHDQVLATTEVHFHEPKEAHPDGA